MVRLYSLETCLELISIMILVDDCPPSQAVVHLYFSSLDAGWLCLWSWEGLSP